MSKRQLIIEKTGCTLNNEDILALIDKLSNLELMINKLDIFYGIKLDIFYGILDEETLEAFELIKSIKKDLFLNSVEGMLPSEIYRINDMINALSPATKVINDVLNDMELLK